VVPQGLPESNGVGFRVVFGLDSVLTQHSRTRRSPLHAAAGAGNAGIIHSPYGRQYHRGIGGVPTDKVTERWSESDKISLRSPLCGRDASLAKLRARG
jgi:hypothetical protein